MKKLLLLIFSLYFFSAQSFAGSCPDGSDPVKSISADGTYFVYNCGGNNDDISNNSSESTNKNSERFYEDQPDATDDHQIHFNYIIAKNGEDREWDINGKMEKIINEMNKIMLKATSSNKGGDGVARKYKFDYRKDGKLDITFVELDKTYKRLDLDANNDIIPFLYFKKGMKNKKKTYFNFVDIDSRDGGSASVGFGSLFLRNKSIPNDYRKVIIGLHELLHTQGMGYNCMPWIRSYEVGNHSSHLKDYDQRTMLNAGETLGKIYAHDIDNCPQLMDSIYLSPTSNEPYEPYQINCLFKLGKYDHPNFLRVVDKLKKDGRYNWKIRFGPSCGFRDQNKGPGYYLFESNTNILETY